VLWADDAAVRASEEAVHAAGSGNWVALSLAEYTLGVVLLSRDDVDDRSRGLDIMVRFGELMRRRRTPFLTPLADLWIAQEKARRGDRDAAVAVMRHAVDELHQGERLGHVIWGAGVLVETLLERGGDDDLAEAEQTIDRLTILRPDQALVIRDITLLRLRALLARARGDDATYRELTHRYRATAQSLGFEGPTWTAMVVDS